MAVFFQGLKSPFCFAILIFPLNALAV